MGIFDWFRDWLLEPLLKEDQARMTDIELARDYRRGNQRQQMRVRAGQADDNLIINFSGLIIDRGVSMLFGNGVEFDCESEEQAEYLKRVWDANKQQILLHRLALSGGESGTCYLKIILDGTTDKSGEALPRLVSVDPLWVRMETNPEDFDQVDKYIICYKTTGPDGKEMARRQEIEYDPESDTWTITDWYASDATRGKWELLNDPIPWEYPFPPILHWQNLPNAFSVYGQPDITDDMIALQDRINFIAGNISKIIRLHAHPMRVGRNIGNMDTIELGPDKMVRLTGDGEIVNVEMQSDLSSSQEFLRILRQSLFDIARMVDIDSIPDKLGALTNFGLRVLYMDTINKIGTKRELYGDALIELNWRLSILRGLNVPNGGKIIWHDFLPINEVEAITAVKGDLEMGIVSKETVAAARGYDWQQEQERLSGEASTGSNIGAMLLRNFNRGQPNA